MLLLGDDQPLKQACSYFSEQGIPFPKFGLKDDEKNLKECYMFDGADNPGAPLLLYFPLVNDTFQRYVAPGKLTSSSYFIDTVSVLTLSVSSLSQYKNPVLACSF